MMPAKLQLDVLRTLQSSARHGNANAEKLQLSRALPTKTVSSFASHSSPVPFRPSSKVLQHLCLRFTQVAPYFIIQLFDLPSRHAENLAPLLALLSNPIH
nr:CFF_HP1_G0016080.mRNA.1.CDS.1 [Saccharomyces cerevisiae]